MTFYICMPVDFYYLCYIIVTLLSITTVFFINVKELSYNINARIGCMSPEKLGWGLEPVGCVEYGADCFLLNKVTIYGRHCWMPVGFRIYLKIYTQQKESISITLLST